MVRNSFVLRLYKTPKISCVTDLIKGKPDQQITSRSGSGRGVQNWIDSLRVHVKAGHGGNGHPKYGGIGGKGGDIIVQASDTTTQKWTRPTKQHVKGKSLPIKSLYDVFTREFAKDSTRQRLKAGTGEDAARQKLIGQCGAEKIIKVQ